MSQSQSNETPEVLEPRPLLEDTEAIETKEEEVGRRLRANDPSKRQRRKPEPVEVRRLAHPAVWETAIRLADGKAERIQVESPTRVTIVIG